MWLGLAAFAVIGVTLWALVLAPPRLSSHRSLVVDSMPRSDVVDSSRHMRVAGEQFASLAEQTEWLVDITSIEDCQNLNRSAANPGPCETVPLKDQAMHNICRLKTMKVEDPTQWELTLKELGAQPQPAPQE